MNGARDHVPGRCKYIVLQNIVDIMNLDGLPCHIPDRREGVDRHLLSGTPWIHPWRLREKHPCFSRPGQQACDPQWVRNTAPSYDWGVRPVHSGRDVIEPQRFTPQSAIFTFLSDNPGPPATA
jgi:hypothetical protein